MLAFAAAGDKIRDRVSTYRTKARVLQLRPGATDHRDCEVAQHPRGTPVKLSAQKGKVVLIDFWAYPCINCQRSVPHVVAWNKAYKDTGLEIIGVHAPEFTFEKSIRNLKSAVKSMDVTYPVSQDNNLNTWNNYRNRYWPAEYPIDATGDGAAHQVR